MFHFDKRVNPNSPIDPNDLAPYGWERIGTPERVKCLPGFADTVYLHCVSWQKRELGRLNAVVAESTVSVNDETSDRQIDLFSLHTSTGDLVLT
jgi:hypothetical protein